MGADHSAPSRGGVKHEGLRLGSPVRVDSVNPRSRKAANHRISPQFCAGSARALPHGIGGGVPIMRTRSVSAALVASVSLMSMTSRAPAQERGPVQPVPYQPSQPVPVTTERAAPTSGAAPVGNGNDVIHLKNGGIMRGSIV